MPLLCPECAAELEAGYLRCRTCGADARRAQEVPEFADDGSLEFSPLDLNEDPLFVTWRNSLDQLSKVAPALAEWALNDGVGTRPPVEVGVAADRLATAVLDAAKAMDERLRLMVARRKLAEGDAARRAPEQNVVKAISILRHMVGPHASPADRDRAYCEGRAWFFNFPVKHREDVAQREPELAARAVRLLLASRYRKPIEKQLRRETGRRFG